MISDLLLIEMGGGGDLTLRGNDLASITGYENTPYLALFSGNDWWGNYLLTDQILCETEDILNTTPLTSAGRVQIENAIKSDLKFLNNIAGTSYTIATSITNSNRIDIIITINGQQFNLMWNPDKAFLTYQIK